MQDIIEAKKYLDNISQLDKVLVIHHTDLDGIASGILLFDYVRKMTNKVSQIAVDYKQKFNYKKYAKFNKIIFCDLSFDGVHSLVSLLNKKDKDILFIDHHPKGKNIPENIITYYNDKNKYTPCSQMIQKLTDGKYWLGVAGTLSDYGHKYKENIPYINYFLKKEKIELNWFLENIVFVLSNSITYFNKNLSKIFFLIKRMNNYNDINRIKMHSDKVSKDIENIYNKYFDNHEILGKINFYFMKSKYPLKSTIVTKISSEYPYKIFVIAEQDMSNKNIINISGRCQKGNVDIPKMFKESMKGFKNSNSGGHKAAAGGSFPKAYLSTFKNRLEKCNV